MNFRGRKEPLLKNSGSLSAFIQHPLGERRASAHLSYFLAIKAIVFIEIQGRFGSVLMATGILWRTGA